MLSTIITASRHGLFQDGNHERSDTHKRRRAQITARYDERREIHRVFDLIESKWDKAPSRTYSFWMVVCWSFLLGFGAALLLLRWHTIDRARMAFEIVASLAVIAYFSRFALRDETRRNE